MQQYHDLLRLLLQEGEFKHDRTQTGTFSRFGHQMRFDLAKGFPLVTTKRVYWKGVVHELLWFLKGQTNIQYLLDNDVHIWDEWADENGELGPVYGKQWRSWSRPSRTDSELVNIGESVPIDQIKNVIHMIRNDPNSRRMLVSAWNVAELPDMALQPCHVLFQFYVNNRRELSCQVYQRSCDVFLGLPFNIASYALLTHMVANVCNLYAGELVWTGGDVHLYSNHVEQAQRQLTRAEYPLPRLGINPLIHDIDQYQASDIELLNYISHPAIKAPVAV